MDTVKRDISSELASAPVGRLLLKLAVPTVIAQLVNLLYNIVDRIYIGHMPQNGDAALTGIGLCFPVVYFIAAFTSLVAQGGAPRAAIAMGRGDDDGAERILGSCFTTLIVIAVLLTAAFELWGEKLLWLFGASKDTIVYSLPYMRIYAAGSLFVMLSMGLNMFITTQGFTTFSMITVLIGALCNIILDPIFIFALDMGVEGAALATVISQAVSAFWVVSFLLSRKSKLRIKRKYLIPDMKILLPALALGLAPFVMQTTEALVNISFNSSLQKYGGDVAVASMTIATTVMQMIWLPGQGIGMGAQPIISYNYGAGNAERVKKAFLTMFKYAGIYMVTFWGLVELFPQFFIGIFNDSPALMETATWVLRLYVAATGLMAAQMAIQQTFMAIGKAKAALFIACLRKVIFLIPLIYILPNFFEDKTFAVMLAEPVSDTISVTTATIVFICVFGRELRRMREEKRGQ